MPARAAPEPAHEGRLDGAAALALFAGLDGPGRVGLAVSGGSDSVAMAVLYGEARALRPELPEPFLLTVDHGLRREAAADVAFVGALGQRLGWPVAGLAAARRPATGNLQDWAREERYRLLAAEARARGADAVLLAHTADDQAETVLMRIARGSGVRGLAGMAREVERHGMRFRRPLLDLARSDLREVLVARGIAWREDPGNRDPAFDRARVRTLLPALAGIGLHRVALTGLAASMARASEAIDAILARTAAAALSCDPSGGMARLDLAAGGADGFARAPDEVRLRLLSDAIRWTGARRHGPRLTVLEGIDRALREGAFGGATVAGVALRPARGSVWLHPEPGRTGLPEIVIAPGETVRWAGRLDVTLEVPVPHGGEGACYTVGPLGRDRACLADGIVAAAGLPAAVLATLPALRRDGALVAVPALGLDEPGSRLRVDHLGAVPPGTRIAPLGRVVRDRT